MNYSKIADEFNISRKQAEKIVKYAFDVLLEEVEDKGKSFAGRGYYFKKVERPARNYRNPRTGELGTAEPATYMCCRKKI